MEPSQNLKVGYKMAQILKVREQMTMDAYISWFVDNISTLHDFVSIDTDEQTGDVTLRYTQESYILLYKAGTDLDICVGNSNFESTLSTLSFGSSSSGANVFCILVKSDSGDISIRTYNSVNYYQHDYYIGSLIKCKDSLTDTDTWGFIKPANITGDSSQTFSPYVLITDDVTHPYGNLVYISSGTGNQSAVYGGWNPYAQITVLVPMCAVSSRCVGVNTYFMLFSPRMYDGFAVINGKRYYCIGGVAMLDEAVT